MERQPKYFYAEQGDILVMEVEELRRLFQKSDFIYADEVPVEGTTVDDIDLGYFKDFFQRTYETDWDRTDMPLTQ